MNELIADVRYALRNLRTAPAFSALLICILALGIACTVSVFSLVDGVLLRPLPYRDPGRLVMLSAYQPQPPFSSNGSLPYVDFDRLRAHAHALAEMTATFRAGWSRVTLTSGMDSVHAQGAFVTPNLFGMFGRAPLLGRTFSEEEDRRAEHVAVICEGLWRERFASSPQVLNESLEIDRRPWRIIGVMPGDFQAPFLGTQAWMPMRSNSGWTDRQDGNPLEHQRWDVMARVRPGVSFQIAEKEVNSMISGYSIRVVPLREYFTGRVRKPMLVLLCAVGFLFLITCANIANLLVARVAERESEMAIRTALGAGSRRLFQQLVTESLTICVLGGICGALGAAAFVPVLKALSPAETPLLDAVEMNARSLLVTALLSVAVGVLLGTAPAWHVASGNLRQFLSGTTRSTTEGHRGRNLRRVLVSLEFALAMVLLTAAGLMIRSFVAVHNVEAGFRPQNVLTIQVNLPGTTPAGEISRFYAELASRTARLPGVQAVGGASNLFFLGESRTHALRQVEGRPPEPKSSWTPLVWTQVTGDYFQAMGIPLLHGRFFSPSDRPDSPAVAIVNESLARRYWPGEDAVGKRLKGFDPRGKNDDWLTVAGVVRDTRSGGLERKPLAQIYEVQAQRGEQATSIVVRSNADPRSLASEMRALIRSLAPLATIGGIGTMQQLLDRQQTERRFETWLIGIFSLFSFGLAGLGVFAIMHYSVAAKTSEIGIRMALGANRGDVMSLVLGEGTRLALFGIAAGTLGAVWLTETIRGMLFDVQPLDPPSYAGAALVLGAVAVAACYIPARRASRIDPMAALRARA